jgi:transposase
LRSGAEYFTSPGITAQRRYEALRAYFVDGVPAAEVADRFGYSTASVHQMATLLRKGSLRMFTQARPGPKGPRTITGTVRERVLELRARGHSVTEIAVMLTADGLPISAQSAWQILHEQGLPRLARRENTRRGTPMRLDPVKAEPLASWPAGTQIPCDHAGLLLLLPQIITLGLDSMTAAAGYPQTSTLSAFHSIATLLLAKCGRITRVHHIDALTEDRGLALALGLTALPKATHLASYSYRARRESSLKLMQLLTAEVRKHGLATGAEGFNCDFHAIRHHGSDAVLEEHYVPARSQRTRSVLTFFAQDHASTEMVYANADLTKAEQAAEILAFAGYWKDTTGAQPGLLVFDSQLTSYKILDELSGRGIHWLTLRKRGPKILRELADLPASAWSHARIDRAGRYRNPRLHEDIVTLDGISAPVRQIAVKNIGHDEPTLLITSHPDRPAKDLFARYAERMIIENELDAYISGFHLNALSSGVPLNVDLDTTLTVLAGSIYRMFARSLTRYHNTTPETIWRHFLDATGTLHITGDTITCALSLRNNHPVLIQAGYADTATPIPWLAGKTLRFTFPPR